MTIPFNLLVSILSFLVISNSSFSYAQENTNRVDVNIFPNPNSGTFYITLVNEESCLSQLFGLDGKLAKSIYLQPGLNYVSIDLPAGVYILKVGKNEEQEQFKVVIN